jgi:serine/threonine protein kinase
VVDVGDVIAGRYEVRGVLGEGGTGIVYDAVRTDDGQPVALKVMHAALAGDHQVRGRFRREAAILERLEGPHICPILDHGEVPGEANGQTLVYLAMARLDGPSLEKVLVDEGPLLPVSRVVELVLAVLAALRAAHAQGVIHRDLKPANVILERGDRVVVVDFGMAKIVTGGGLGTTNLTTHNMVFGTPEYMSPEQARGDELDVRCDVYATGVMLYEMLSGQKPFTAETALGVLTAHLTSELVRPSALVTGRVSKALEAVVLHALARDREQRYATAAALAAALLHARAVPDDVDALRPQAFSARPEGTDAFARTLPAISPLSGLTTDDAFAKTSEVESVTIPEEPKRHVPVSAPPAPSRSSQPPASRDDAKRLRELEAAEKRRWGLIWVLVVLVSVGIGVALALR